MLLGEIATLPDADAELPMPGDPRLARLAAALVASPGDSRTTEALAASFGTSVRTITRGFKQQTGLTFSSWRQRARLIRASEMLAFGETVTTVAYEVGYASVGAFIEMYKKHVGKTPGQVLRSA